MKQSVPFTGLSLSGFCMQISILLKSAVPLYEGLSVMAEDASSPREKEILIAMSDKLRMGFPFSEAAAEAGCFPAYVTQMTVLGERTGTLDETMEHLSRFYEKEYRLGENLRRAVTYPAVMIVMLLVILFILFTRVMPIFSGVYEQLGTSIPEAAQAAIRFGGILSGAALIFAAVLIAAFAVIRLTSPPRTEEQPVTPAAALPQKSFLHCKDLCPAPLLLCHGNDASLRDEYGRGLPYGCHTGGQRFCALRSQSLRKGAGIGKGFL